ncbi:hypothetical protein B0H67DRAFT_580366 [Lasiosphaeris hirsuta]|uniref:Uncharacterized protein n=1 Tax=Lasiosphaeris hirsuta TaxID=260670 RepID=A0AA40AG89_9PEZI|nr:hypothetical protein B0H67DRAFT_580366 [Lasiosphaeris hirsuta]
MLFLRLALALPLIVAALDDDPEDGRNYQLGMFSVPEISNDVWEDALATPNATREARMTSPDLAVPYPGNTTSLKKGSLDWTWKIEVRDNVPLPSLKENESKDDPPFTTGTQILLAPPDSLAGDDLKIAQDASWQVCLTSIIVRDLKSDATDVDPSCGSVLPAACISDLKDRLAKDYNNPLKGIPCSGIVAPEPESCRMAFGGNDVNASHVTALSGPTYFGGSDSAKIKNGSYEYLRWSDSYEWAKDRHVAGNFTTYDQAIRQVWIIGMRWAYSNETGIKFGESTPPVSLTCLRPNVLPGNRQLADGKKTEDANKPETTSTTGPQNAGVSVRVNSFLLVAMVSAFAAGFLL